MRKQEQLQDKHLHDRLLAYMGGKRWTRARLALELDMSESTLNRRLARPGDFTVCELRRMQRLMGCNGYDRLFESWEV